MKVLIIHGANVNMVGIIEPQTYGEVTYSQINEMIRDYAQKKGIQVEIFQSNQEGQVVDVIQRTLSDDTAAILINPGDFTYSYPIRGAVLAVREKVPAIEICLSTRRIQEGGSVISPVVRGIIAGFGPYSYILGLDAAIGLKKA